MDRLREAERIFQVGAGRCEWAGEVLLANRLVHKYRYTLIGLGPSIWLRVFIQISDPALETRLDFSGSP